MIGEGARVDNFCRFEYKVDMKKYAIVCFLLCICRPAFSFFPFFFGARSLSLGYASVAFNYDVNSIYLNPSILSLLNYSASGYQYEYGYRDYRNGAETLSGVLGSDLRNFESLPTQEKIDILAKLNEIFSAKEGMQGFRYNNPGVAGHGFGFSLLTVDAALMNPVSNDILQKGADAVTNADIASLKMNFIGLHYKQYSFAVAFSLTQGVNAGITLHYLKGQISEFTSSLLEPPFGKDVTPKEYLAYGWEQAASELNRINFDLGLSADIGQYFKLGLAVRNALEPTINTSVRDVKLERRYIAGIAFRPSARWGIYLDADLKKSDLYLNGNDAQPVSLGVEATLFKGKLSLRAGLLNDLTEKYFFGSHSNILYGLGMGFNLSNFLIDAALGVDRSGHIQNLGLSAFYLIQGKN